MILPLLKKLPTIRPSQTNTVKRGAIPFLSTHGFATLVCLACVFVSNVESSAQAFREPAVPGVQSTGGYPRVQPQGFSAPSAAQASTPSPTMTAPQYPAASQMEQALMAAKLKHAEALREQMLRVEKEQAAPYGFAQEAFQAQQAYLAEMAYNEYLAYQKIAREKLAKQAKANRVVDPRIQQVAAGFPVSPNVATPGLQPNLQAAGQNYAPTPTPLSAPTGNAPIPTRPQPAIQPKQPSVMQDLKSQFGPSPGNAMPGNAMPANQTAGSTAPPVHVPPTDSRQMPESSILENAPARPTVSSVNMSFGDEPQSVTGVQQVDHRDIAIEARPSQYRRPLPMNHRQLGISAPRTNTQMRNRQTRSSSQQQPVRKPRVVRRSTNAARQARASAVQEKSVVPIKPERDLPTAVGSGVAASPNQPTPASPQPVVSKPIAARTQRPVPQKKSPFGKRYIIENGNAGLQDKIASFLSKPEYRSTSKANPGYQPTPQARTARAKPQSKPITPQQVAKIPRRQLTSGPVPRKLPTPQVARASVQARQPIPNASVVPTYQSRRHQAIRYPVQQASRTIPAQSQVRLASAQSDESKQIALTFPISPELKAPAKSNATQPRAFESPQVVPTSPREFVAEEVNEIQPPPSRVAWQEQNRIRQISVLKRQEDDNAFSSQIQQPQPMPEPEQGDSNAQTPDDEFQRIERELQRQMRERGSDPATTQSEESQDSTDNLDKMVEDLEKQLDEELSGADSQLDDESTDDEPRQPVEKSCDEFRSQLLMGSIREIALDISPPASAIRDQFTAISRSWTDRSGNIIATGTMIDLRRGYVIIDSMNGRVKIPYGKLSDADYAAIAEYWRIPATCTVGGIGTPTRNWMPQTYTWKATNLCHKPLYFENIQLERYGHSHGPFLQPVQSVAHFFVSMFSLPYQTTLNPPNECQYALGFYRPGNCAPWLKDPVPISLDGFKRQALFVTGAGLIP